jgi:hypothetical protein
VWWYTPVIPALWRLRQKDLDVEISLFRTVSKRKRKRKETIE